MQATELLVLRWRWAAPCCSRAPLLASLPVTSSRLRNAQRADDRGKHRPELAISVSDGDRVIYAADVARRNPRHPPLRTIRKASSGSRETADACASAAARECGPAPGAP